MKKKLLEEQEKLIPPPTTSEADKIPRASSIPADEIGSFYVNISNSGSSSNSQVTSTGISSKSSYCKRTRIVNCSSGNAFPTLPFGN